MSREAQGGKLGAMRSPIPALSLLLAACGGRAFGPPMPTTMAPAEAGTVAAWVGETEARQPVMMRFRWTFIDEKGTAKGRGSAIIVPPDSLRFDFRGPLGSGAGAAAVVGNTALWAEPEEEVNKLVPNYPILWAMLGRARHPDADVAIRAFSDDRVTAWRYVSGADTVDYQVVRHLSRQMFVDVRQAGERIGRVATTYDAAGFPAKARLEVPSRPARLELAFYGAGPLDTLPVDLWARPSDAP